jgi:aspartate kinase
MKIIVKKYGGTSVATVKKIKDIAKKVAREADSNRIVIVLSAMGKTTDHLASLANKCSKNPDLRDYDLLVSSGEQISISLLSMALKGFRQRFSCIYRLASWD